MPTERDCAYCDAPSRGARFCGQCGAPVVVADPTDARIGQRVLGRYVLLSVLGEGAMGKVYRAEQRTRRLRRQVAVKILHPDMSQERALRARFLRECALMTRLVHPNVVTVFDMGELEDGCLALVMELIEGETVRTRLERGPLAPEEALPLARSLFRALAAAHAQGIVHRDIKPDNLMLFRHVDGRLDLKLLDFGVAQGPAADGVTGHGQLVGTPPYMSPEQLMGRPLDGRSDLYAAALTVHEMLTGAHPLGQASSVLAWMNLHLDGTPARLDVPGVPEAAAAALRRAMAKSAENRPATALEMADACNVAGASVHPGHRRTTPPARRRLRSPRPHAPTHTLDAHPHPIVDLDPPVVPGRPRAWTSWMIAAAALIAFGAALAGLVDPSPVASGPSPAESSLSAPDTPLERL